MYFEMASVHLQQIVKRIKNSGRRLFQKAQKKPGDQLTSISKTSFGGI